MPDLVDDVADQIDNVADLGGSLFRRSGSDAIARAHLAALATPSTMFPSGGEEALERVAAMVKRTNDLGEDGGRLAESLSSLRNVPNAGGGTGAWINDIEGHLTSEAARGYPYIFEANVLGDAANGKYLITIDPSTGQKGAMQLSKLKGEFNRVPLKRGGDARVVIEGECYIDGKFALLDAKSAMRLPASKYRTELEKQVALVADKGGGYVVWSMKPQHRPQSLWQAARDLEVEYEGSVKVVFMDEAAKRELTAADMFM